MNLGLVVARWFDERPWAYLILWILIIPVMGYLYLGDWQLQRQLGVGVLDLQFAFTGERAAAVLAKLPAEVRHQWVWALGLDYLYAALYALLLTTWLYKTARPFQWNGRPWFRWLLTVPLLAGALDMLENACHLYLLHTYPVVSPGVVPLASLYASTKWILALGALGVIIALGIVRIAGNGLQKSDQ